MQINPIHFMQDIPPGVAQIKQHFQTLQKKQKSLSNYPKTILKLREFKEAYPLIPRYISKYATNETITHNNKPVYVRYFNQSEKAQKLIIFFPGGNFCFNQQYDYDLLCEALINDNTQLLVMPPVLAPENIFPSAHEKSLELVTHVIQNREKYMPGNEVLLVATGSGCHIANWVYQRLPNRSTIKKLYSSMAFIKSTHWPCLKIKMLNPFQAPSAAILLTISIMILQSTRSSFSIPIITLFYLSVALIIRFAVKQSKWHQSVHLIVKKLICSLCQVQLMNS